MGLHKGVGAHRVGRRLRLGEQKEARELLGFRCQARERPRQHLGTLPVTTSVLTPPVDEVKMRGTAKDSVEGVSCEVTGITELE